MPLLTIIMATKNEDILYLQQCLDSISSQSFQDYNFNIIIDSDDDSNIDYLKGICNQNDKIKLLNNSKNPGVASSRNFGIMNSSSKYIAIIDSDDYYDKDKLALQVGFLEGHQQISLVGSNIFLVNDENRIIGERLYPEFYNKIKKEFLFKMPIANSSLVVKRKDLLDVGLFDENYNKAEDLELWLRFLSKGKKMHNIQKKLVYYRSPENENLKRGREHYRNYYSAIKKHGKNIWPLHFRIFSLSMFYLIQLIPNYFLSYLLSTSIVHKIKNINSIN